MNPGENDPPGTLNLTPLTQDITLRGTDQTLSFRAVSPKRGDVTNLATWSVSNNAVGAVVQGKLTVRGSLEAGGVYTVTASHRNETGSATLRIKAVLPDIVENGAPADAKDYFSGAATGTAPQSVYPFDNTLMAPNVLQMRIQWQQSGHTVFRLRLDGPTVQRTIYSGCSNGGRCTYNVDDKVWRALAQSAAGQEVTLRIAGSSQKGGAWGESPPVNLRFSPEDIRGGLYYFSPTITGIKRVPLGASKPVDFINRGDETGCAGCHAVSRDGKQVAVEFGSGDTHVGSTVVDGAMPRMRKWNLTPSIAWNYAWFNPSGDKLITNWRSQMILRDPKSGMELSRISNQQIGGSFGAAMPEWSPDGKYIAMVRNLASSTYDFELNNSGDIVIVPVLDAMANTFGNATTLVRGQPGQEVHIWPTWSPDSQWLVFNSHKCDGGTCNSYNARNTRLRIIRVFDDKGNPLVNPQPIELLAGTHQPGNTNNWPKFAPFLQQGRYAFVVYSASYAWGHQGGGQPQLFMFGLDLAKARQDQDPSFHPIWLPFQDNSTGNHSAIWTTDVACVTDKDCPAEFQCVNGQCTPRLG